MSTELRRPAMALLTLSALLGCPKPPPPPVQHRAAATVDGRPILAMELRRELWRLHGKPEAGDESRVTLATAMLDHMVEQDLLLAAARSAGITVSAHDLDSAWEDMQTGYRSRDFKASLYAQLQTPERLRQVLQDRLVMEAYLREQGKDALKITDAQVKAYFEAHPQKYNVPAQVHARQVVVRTPEEAEVVHKRLVAGESFEKIARERSVAPEKEHGGDLGFFPKGVMPAVFDRCFSLEVGAISDVVASEYGQHIFQVTEKRLEQNLPLEAVAEDIRETLRREQTEAVEMGIIKALKAKAAIVTYPDAIAWVADIPDGGA